MVVQVVKKSNRPRLVDAQVEEELRKKLADKAGDASGQPAAPAEKSEQELKADRLAQALRENLHKRKEQARTRDQGDAKDAGEKSEGP
jgi:hypothetical protein